MTALVMVIPLVMVGHMGKGIGSGTRMFSLSLLEILQGWSSFGM
jgi:hypothetical protein